MTERDSKSANESAVQVKLLPLGTILEVRRGQSLRDVLFEHGVEFPCGGEARCRGCLIQLEKGSLSIHEDDARLLSREELAAGWRLGCRIEAEDNLQIKLAEWEAPILSDGSPVSFSPTEGLGVAIDLGTTTIVAQLLDLRTGHVLAVRSGMNAQGVHGADIMSRIEFAVQGGLTVLTEIIRHQIKRFIEELLRETELGTAELKEVILVGNTAMHHLFCGLDVISLAHYPFESGDGGWKRFASDELGWDDVWPSGGLEVRFLPALGGFVGSDILAGLLATELHQSKEPAALVDLGTNGEIVVGNRERLLCTSTAAGPAFEGARIEMGMRAVSGAIAGVQAGNGEYDCHVLGNGKALGICGSGLVDAVATGLQTRAIQPNGRLTCGERFVLTPGVHLTQCDIRELQLAKGAIAAGLEILARRWGMGVEELSRVYLAGAFGNYMNVESACRIGLLPYADARVEAVGNTALRGAKLSLFQSAQLQEVCDGIRSKVEHLSLHEDAEFQDIYAGKMSLG